MKKHFLKLSIFFLLTSGFFIFGNTLSAQEKVKLQVPFPGVEEITLCEKVGGGVQCQGIGNLVVVIYQWTLGFAMILAVLLLVFAGFAWMTARGNKGQIQKAQKIIQNTIVGLALAIGSYFILFLLNPSLVEFQSLVLKKVEEIDLSIVKQIELSQEFQRLNYPPGQQTKAACMNIMRNQSLVNAYKQAARVAGVPWELIAAIHFRETNNKASAFNPMQFDSPGGGWRGNGIVRKYGDKCVHSPGAFECAGRHLKELRPDLTEATTDPSTLKNAMKKYNAGPHSKKSDDYWYTINDPDHGVVGRIKGTVEKPGGGRMRVDNPDKRPGAYIIFDALKRNCQ